MGASGAMWGPKFGTCRSVCQGDQASVPVVVTQYDPYIFALFCVLQVLNLARAKEVAKARPIDLRTTWGKEMPRVCLAHQPPVGAMVMATGRLARPLIRTKGGPSTDVDRRRWHGCEDVLEKACVCYGDVRTLHIIVHLTYAVGLHSG